MTRSLVARPRLFLALLVGTPALACAPGDVGDAGAPVAIEASKVARSPGGMVSTGHPLATAAGVSMLERGGNAVDAAVAAAFTLAVVEPSMSGLGGRTQILLRAPSGDLHGLDATTQAPASYDPATAPQAGSGYPTVGVPGTVAGLTAALERWGSLPLAVVMEPAIRHAGDGFRLLPGEALRHAAVVDELSEGARAHFLRPDGTPHEPGDRFVQADLAATLRAVAEGGADAFYRGDIARRIAEDMAAHGAPVTAASLAAYRAEDVPVVRGSYRGYELAGTWLPSYGAITIEILQILETVPAASLAGPAWAPLMAQAVALAYEDRRAQSDATSAARLTSKGWARERAAHLRMPVAAAAASAPSLDAGGPSEHTTHLTTADREGRVVALTQSNGPNMGSKVVSPGLGFLYAATLGGYLGDMAPGERARSHISPFLVTRGSEPFLGLGAAGGSRIPPAIAAVVSRVVDQGMPLDEALAAPRVYPDGEGLEMETHAGAWSAADVEAVGAMGFPVEARPSPGSFGRVHAVQWDAGAGVWVGAADPDWEGSAAGPREGGR